ncbi:MAG: glycosyltransferase, partial [Flavobacteriaceae bacterium]|nr:glycosyltransferase [Flavobacteriaceae bacterium]
MKILQLGKFYPPVFGGIQNVMYEFATGLNDENIHCDVLCSNTENKYIITHYDTYKVFRTKSYGVHFSTSISPQMITILKSIQDDYDIISIHFPDPMAALALFISKPKCKVVLHWHSDVIKQKYLLKLFEPLQNWVINRADLIIGATETHIKESNQANLMIDKSLILPYPFDSNALKKCINLDLLHHLKTTYKNKKIIFAMGRLIYYKGFKYLVEAAKHLNDEYIILIGGEGELKKDLEEKIFTNHLESKIKLIGFIPHSELGTYYELCDIFCLPSTF